MTLALVPAPVPTPMQIQPLAVAQTQGSDPTTHKSGEGEKGRRRKMLDIKHFTVNKQDNNIPNKASHLPRVTVPTSPLSLYTVTSPTDTPSLYMLSHAHTAGRSCGVTFQSR
eukprot:gnl/Chilomastix_caulleri/4382.p1 GENE.gnl/Chilomastix_caulleri/4382~~gnl/Chilomastix_caulleri/4382.p1  ORF type:complete len:112 (+),score=19.60 gnl/Chilomastix_caulleri/4382:100-435(+)